MKRRAQQSGFTLLELMVALTAGLILITAVYYVGAGSSRHFQEQQRISQTQTNVRTAMEQLRFDVSRAGFMGTPNSRGPTGRNCAPGISLHTQAVELVNENGLGNIPNAAENGSHADTLRIVGNYATGDEYHSSWSAQGQFILDTRWQSYRRSFMPNGALDTAAFQEAFVPGRLIRFTSPRDFIFITRIESVGADGRTININPPLPNTENCSQGFGGEGGLIAPLSRIEYSIQGPAGLANLLPRGGATSPVTGAPSYLVRREIPFGDPPGAPLAGRTRVVLQWAVDFEVDAILDTAAAGLPPDLQLRDGADTGTALQSVVSNPAATPEQVRSLIVQIGARTPEQDSLFPFRPRTGPDAPMRSFRVFPARGEFAARVRSLRSEIFLPNLAR